MPLDIDEIRDAFFNGRVEWRQHALVRILERGISRADISHIVNEGEIIEEYTSQAGLPSCLIFGKVKEEVYHAVVGWNDQEKRAYVITVYRPDREHFEQDLKTRKKR